MHGRAFRKLKVGDPLDANTKMGPVVSLEHKQKIEKYIELARQNGHQVISSGDLDETVKSSKKGYYIMPTVILNADDQSKLMTDEIFGPVVCIVPFDDDEEVKDRNLESVSDYCLSLFRSLNVPIRSNTVYAVVSGRRTSVELIEWRVGWK